MKKHTYRGIEMTWDRILGVFRFQIDGTWYRAASVIHAQQIINRVLNEEAQA